MLKKHNIKIIFVLDVNDHIKNLGQKATNKTAYKLCKIQQNK
jgi:hypothetical protein